ncbi:MAG: ferredoxin [Candidatus Falkowbacteria bacterium]|nr:ferredoxin [Candidatus Falkowbacteria bacterium]
MIIVDQDLCIGCGLCANTCPDVFRMNDDGKSEVFDQKNIDCAKKAAANCPVEAISVS